MSRSVQVTGEALICVKGPSNSAIASLTELGLCETELTITVTPNFQDVNIDAWGQAAADVQRMLAYIEAKGRLIQFDPDVLAECNRLALGGNVEGSVGRAGALMGNGLARFAPGNNFIGFNVAAPQNSRPWRFLYAYFINPGSYPQTTKRQTIDFTVRGIPYVADPWQGGVGAHNYQFYSRTLDS